MRFDGRLALVTGGASGLGERTAERFAAEGACVVVADLDRERAEAVASRIGGHAVSIDVSEPSSVEAAFASVEASRGRAPDILVNSAGLLRIGALLDMSAAEFARVMAVNVTGGFLCAQRAARGMKAQGFGRIVNIGSISGERAGIGRVAYGTSKAAVIGLTRQLAMELAAFGITANAIAPGPVRTPMTHASYSDETVEAYTAMIPSRTLGTTDDMAHAILFLASEEAAYVNGVVLPVDGGYLASGIARTASLGGAN